MIAARRLIRRRSSGVDARDAPEARRWGSRFVRQTGIRAKGFRRHAAPHTVRIAVVDIAESCVPDPDSLLRTLLAAAIGDCAAVVREQPAGCPAPAALSTT